MRRTERSSALPYQNVSRTIATEPTQWSVDPFFAARKGNGFDVADTERMFVRYQGPLPGFHPLGASARQVEIDGQPLVQSSDLQASVRICSLAMPRLEYTNPS